MLYLLQCEMVCRKEGKTVIIDVHCHILPGVDDGARNGKSTARMIKIASEEGIDAIIATPHFVSGTEEEKTLQIKQRYTVVKKWLKEHYPDMKLYLGNELYYSDGLIEALDQGIALTMNGTRYVLVEFPVYVEYAYIWKAIQRFVYAGYIPIIAHVERYVHLQKKEYIQEFVNMGAYIQVNASSVIGKHGSAEKRYIKGLLKKQLVHFIGTDAHSSRERRPEMLECKRYLLKKIGVEETRRILEKNPAKMLRGEELYG